jgi:hypothetical protein
MVITPRLAYGLACVSALPSRPAGADDTTAADRTTAARVSVDPLPIVEKLKFLPSYQFSEGSTRYRAELQFEPVIPYQGLLIPGLDVDDVWSVARAQLTAESLQNSNGTASGLENLNFVDLAAHRFAELSIGVGFGTVFPMATNSELGPAKWQLGPAIGFHDQVAAWFSIGGLAQALWSVAGSSEVAHQSYATVQPFVTVHPYPGVVLVSDAEMSFYWAGGSTTIPVDLGLGYAFSKQFVGTVKGTLTVAGNDEGAVKATVELTFLP